MEKEWEPVNFDILPYKETGTYIVKTSEEMNQLLDDHIVMTQSMSFSPYKKPFEDRISKWESTLRTTQVTSILLPLAVFSLNTLRVHWIKVKAMAEAI